MQPLNDDYSAQFSGTFYLVRKGGRFGVGDRSTHGSGELRREPV